MNYFTKEWYELCQKTNAHLLLEEAAEAESFSDEYFQQLYNQKLMEWLVLQEQIASYQAEHEAAKESYVSYEPVDRKKLSKQFHERLIYNQEHIKKMLPEEILKQIADIRVYALDKASEQVIKAVTQFCQDNQKAVENVIREYERYYQKASELFDKNIVRNEDFHDCMVVNIKEMEKTLSILLDNSGGFTDIVEIKFKNYRIIKQDALPENSWWLYDEIYKINGKYELHVLLQNKNIDLIEFIISADNITFRHSLKNDCKFN